MPTYPFCPKTTAFLQPGQYWDLPLSNGTYACARIIQIAPRSRTIFFAGLLDWNSRLLPTAEAIAGARCLAQGAMHIKSIVESGGLVRGIRPLDLDDIEAWEMRGAAHPGGGAAVQRGFDELRVQTADDAHLPVFSTWGYRVMIGRAEQAFGSEG